jgi:hypothetical protein
MSIVLPKFSAVLSHYAPNNIAKRVLDFSTTVSRERLRPQYGDGFAGAPLEQDRGVKPDEERRKAQEIGRSVANMNPIVSP